MLPLLAFEFWPSLSVNRREALFAGSLKAAMSLIGSNGRVRFAREYGSPEMLRSSVRSGFTRPIKTSYGMAHGRMQLVVETGASAHAMAVACTVGAGMPSADMMRPLVEWLTTTLTALGGTAPSMKPAGGVRLSFHWPVCT